MIIVDEPSQSFDIWRGNKLSATPDFYIISMNMHGIYQKYG